MSAYFSAATKGVRSKALFIFVLACGVALLAACNIGGPGGSVGGNLDAGDPLPAFSLKDLDGNIISSEDLLGKPYVVSLFATWCPPCKMELQEFETELWQPLKDQNIGVIGINYGDEDAELIRGFADENNLTFPLLVDMEGSFREEVDARAVPQSFVVDKEGKVINVFVGYTSEAVQAIKKQLTDAAE